MSRIAVLALRVAVAVAAFALVGGGLAFALRGEREGTESAVSAAPSLVPLAAATTPPTQALPVTSAAVPSATTTLAATPEASPGTTAAIVAPAPAVPAVPAAPAAPVVPEVPEAPSPTSVPAATEPDLPKYTDVAVLALAAAARLPSGLTFRECVELPPSTEHWPVPVHLYYEGNGRWLVETHVSEVQVVFTEATGAFSVRNFAPINPGCR